MFIVNPFFSWLFHIKKKSLPPCMFSSIHWQMSWRMGGLSPNLNSLLSQHSTETLLTKLIDGFLTPSPVGVSSVLLLDFFAAFNKLARPHFLNTPIFTSANCCLLVFLLLLKHILSFPRGVLFLHAVSLSISVLQNSISEPLLT